MNFDGNSALDTNTGVTEIQPIAIDEQPASLIKPLNKLDVRAELKVIKAMLEKIDTISGEVDTSTCSMAAIVGSIERGVLDETLKDGGLYSSIGDDLRALIILGKDVYSGVQEGRATLDARESDLTIGERKPKVEAAGQSTAGSKLGAFIVNGLWFVGFVAVAIASLVMVLGSPK